SSCAVWFSFYGSLGQKEPTRIRLLESAFGWGAALAVDGSQLLLFGRSKSRSAVIVASHGEDAHDASRGMDGRLEGPASTGTDGPGGRGVRAPGSPGRDGGC